MTLEYYMDPRSGSCRRVSTVMEHLKIDVTQIFVDLLAQENRTEKILDLNPSGMLPFVVQKREGKTPFILSEASAIMIYLCESYGETRLWPSGENRFQVLKWMSWAAEHFRQPAPPYFDEKVIAPLMGKAVNEARLAEANTMLKLHGPVLDKHLEDRHFVVGDSVTLADFDLAAPLSQMPRSHVPYDQFPNIMRWARHLDETIVAWRNSGKILDEKMNASLLLP